ncbi:MAG: hypothetical protein HS126_23475 [Anaerolineales bacterium]|nr:hypothetical protein [Anaerolineales bacterium]
MINFTGTWDIVSSPDFDDGYLSEEVSPYVKLKQSGNTINGDYHVGYQQGHLDGRLEGEQRVIFSFEGMDEMEMVNGAGTLALEDDRLIFKLMYHQGDAFTFMGKRRS